MADVTETTSKEETLTEFDQLKENPGLLSRYMTHLSKTVKKDDAAKRMVFLTGLSAYSNNPINLFMKGPSSIGKTYITTEALKYYPKEDIWMLGGLSPTALVHEYGIFMDPEKGEEVNFDKRPDKKDYKGDKAGYRQAQRLWQEKIRRSHYLVDLTRKILVFLEAPHFETYNRLRPILSHDQFEISYRFTETKKGLRTRHVVLRGWPACVFCTTSEKYVEDLSTRGFTITPETGADKLKEAIKLKGEQKAQPWRFREDEELELLRMYIQALTGRLCFSNKVVIPYAEHLSEKYPSQLPRDMRDYDHFQALIEMNTLLHLFKRPVLKMNHEYFMANIHDCLVALQLFAEFEETTRTGIPGHIIDFYHEVLVPLETELETVHYNDLVQKHNEIEKRKVSKHAIYKYVEALKAVGYVDEDEDPEDKRKKIIYSVKKPENDGIHWILTSLPFFSLNDFKEWLDAARDYWNPESVCVYEKLHGEYVDLTSRDDLKKHLIENLYKFQYFLDREKLKTQFKQEKKAEIVRIQESQRISGSKLSTQEVIELLRSTLKRGTQKNFEAEAEKQGFSQAEATKLFENLRGSELLMDPEGYWCWG